ncbi:MAG: UDP-N-acetylmuramoyl-L-alanine--D-glutamate ligase [Candidatus Yanofskybacteria bacterium CG10_big_fil_rev_8_21_14_0_10_36_16]|uniref:UDP-N-acetylmuramoyl-L-alanine--D-glutamate ligase n=1 Tax=Candidatus Yanofskybacteria bacterium CG10_big_fil_rev_8_21_14_0_10_36_16 TaxID=1975096 RepID=A0A2J0Q7E1_9BACT|nr:MAG: UDP-N-acetylmuramoyl-L-alanine--D-glutamate ligase [Candidatus Yanofskybacteria bacterium CG10_big_fil_rev_8_21_14_0_10_36_16]
MLKESNNFIKNKKVLLMGLGTLGGGLATAKWLLKHGAILTITDLRDSSKLKNTLDNLKKIKKPIKYVLGEHKKEDFLQNDIIVVNPGVSFRNKFLILAKKHGKQIENELTLFYKICPARTLGVTGTRGKTTTVHWLRHFLQAKHPKATLAGNFTKHPLLEMVDKYKGNAPIVLELPSFLLEFLSFVKISPDVAVITNIYKDHLNRYRGIKDYAETKANIFRYQNKDQTLILNENNNWTKFFKEKKPKSKILFFSLTPFSDNQNGIYIDKNLSIYVKKGKNEKLFYDAQIFIERWGRHNLENLLASTLAASSFGVPLPKIIKKIESLPQVPFRQEVVFKNRKLEIINDTTATSPDASIAAVQRFRRKNAKLILITGGTDADLDYKGWAVEIKKTLPEKDVVFIEGSATDKMLKELNFKNPRVYKMLDVCFFQAMKSIGKGDKRNIILFSPGAKSFEKFKHEFDRGEQFNALVKKVKSALGESKARWVK